MIRVLTLNVWNTSGRYAERASGIRDAIHALQPDLIAFQEALRKGPWDQTTELLDGFGYHTDWARAMTFWEDESFDLGNAVASRWPITDREEVQLVKSRSAISVTVDAPVGPVSFTCTHLHFPPHESMIREQQALAVCELARRRETKAFPAILAGDFNAEPDSDEVRFVTGKHSIDGHSACMHDAWHVAGTGDGTTWARRNPDARTMLFPDRRIDYIFTGYARHGAVGLVEHCRVVCDEQRDGVFPSDHFGVYAELRDEPAVATPS